MNKTKLLFFIILVLATVLRFTYLDRIPNGFIPEEVSTGWNAYSLLKTGRDEWGTLLPLIFKETGGYKLGLHAYLIVPVVALFGVNEFTVRAPAAFAGVLSVFLTYFLAKELFKKRSVALAASLLLAIAPWHISMGRYAIDVNWGIPLFIAGLLLLFKARTQQKLLIPAAIFFGLTYHTYFNYDVFTVLFLSSLFFFKRRVFFTHKPYMVLFFVMQVLFWLPYLLSPTLTTRFTQATSGQTLGMVLRINERRQACEVTYSPLMCRVMYNKVTDKSIELLRNYINHFSSTTFFLYGSKLGLSGMPDRWGFLYLPEFFLILVGFYVVLTKKLQRFLILSWFLLAAVPSSMAGEGHIWRMLTFLPLPQLLGGLGLVYLYRSRRLFRWGALGLSLVLLFLLVRFWFDYTGFFSFFQAKNAYYGFRDAYAYLQAHESEYDAVLVSAPAMGFDQLYIYYLFYVKPDPRIMQRGEGVERIIEGEGWVKVFKIGKWYFEPDPRNLKVQLPDRVLVLTDDSLPPKMLSVDITLVPRVLTTIPYPNGDTAFRIIELTRDPAP